MKTVIDEVLNGEPRFQIIDKTTGEIITSNAEILLITELLQKGTPLDKALFDSIMGDLYRVDKYTKPTYEQGEAETTDIKNGTYIGLWGASHYTKFGITVSASNEDTDMYAYRAMNGVEGYWSGNTVPTIATPTLFTIQLPERIAIKKFSISGSDSLYCKSFKLQGSNDGDNYFDIMSVTNNTASSKEYSTNNIEFYSYYRLSITESGSASDFPAILEFNITSWQEVMKYNKIVLNGIPLTSYLDKQRLLLDIEDTCDVEFNENILPALMTTSEKGFLIQSSGDYINTSVIDAFDHDTENSYWRSLETQEERYIMVTMPINVVPSRFTIKMANVADGKIQGSNNGDDWDNLVTRINTIDGTTVETLDFDVNTDKKYRYFRFIFNAETDDTSSYIYSFEIPYGYISGFDYSRRTFININSLGDREVDVKSISEEGNYEFVYDATTMRYIAYLTSFSRANVENTFTAGEKQKLAGIEVGAEVNIIDGIKVNGKEYLPDGNRTVNLENVEMTTNKVKELDNSETNYPSCAAVKEYVDNHEFQVTVDSYLDEESENPVENKVIAEALKGKQEALTFDEKPTLLSTNPVQSTGIYTAIEEAKTEVGGKIPAVDIILTTESNNPISNSAVAGAVNTLQTQIDNMAGAGEIIILDDAVTENSQNAVKSSAIYAALQTNLATATQNAQTLINQKIQWGTEDLEDGVTPLATGSVYFVYEKEEE